MLRMAPLPIHVILFCVPSSHLHRDNRARDELSVVSDCKMPSSNSHQIIEIKFNNETPLRIHLNKTKTFFISSIHELK